MCSGDLTASSYNVAQSPNLPPSRLENVAIDPESDIPIYQQAAPQPPMFVAQMVFVTWIDDHIRKCSNSII